MTLYKMNKLLVVLFLGIIISWAKPLYPQSQQEKKNISVKSRPFGVLIHFKGNRELICRAPCQITHGLHGIYRLKAWKKGFEPWRTTIFLRHGEQKSLSITLVPKTRWKAGLRSAVLPGWGQFYSEQKIKSIITGSAFIGCLTAAIMGNMNYNDKTNSYNDLQSQLDNFNISLPERSELMNKATDKQHEMEKAYDFQQNALWASVAIWAFNLLDAIIIFPDFNKHINNYNKPAISAKSMGGVSLITVNTAF